MQSEVTELFAESRGPAGRALSDFGTFLHPGSTAADAASGQLVARLRLPAPESEPQLAGKTVQLVLSTAALREIHNKMVQ